MVTVPRDAPNWAQQLANDMTAEFDRVARTGFPVRMPQYSKGNLPSAATYSGCWIFVHDATGGAVPAYSAGGQWLRADTSAVIS